MCGLTGYYLSETFNSSYIEEMTENLKHRGPDSSGNFIDENIALGHRRLSIIDLTSDADQPILSRNGRYVMVFNGEIYNFKEIAEKLDAGVNKNSDTAVILEAYVKYGPSFINELNGMFSIAIYDKKTANLQLWRDRIGIKPLYYYHDGESFAFGSELKAILQLPIKKELNKEAIKDYLFLEYIPEPLSIYKNIYKLEKGHSLTFENRVLKKLCYYDLLDKINPSKGISETEHLKHFNELFMKSVERRMVSDVKVGAFLSGGTDSAAICAAYSELSESPINTYTIGFNDSKHDESGFAKKVSDHLKTQHHQTTLDAKESLELLKRTFSSFDEPFAVSSVLPMFKVSDMAAKDVKVVMSGDGADELFMGYGYYQWHKRMKTIRRTGGKLGLLALKSILTTAGGEYKRAARMFKIGDEERMWIHLWSQDQFMFMESEVERLLDSPYQHETLQADWSRIYHMDLDDYTKISLFDIRHYLANDLLMKVDIATMSTGLEARVPMLDHELVEFAINLPVDMKIKKGTSKYLLKKWLEDKIPKELIYRTKWGFPAPINVWMNKEFKHLIDEYLSTETLRKSGIFNQNEILKLINEFQNGNNYHFKRIWALICFQMWYEEHFSS